MTEYREIGTRIGIFIRANNPTIQQIHGLLGDLLAGDEILPAMCFWVSRPSFSTLHDLIMSGRGTVYRDPLLQELGRIYLPGIVSAIGQIVNGMLDIEIDGTACTIEIRMVAKELNTPTSFLVQWCNKSVMIGTKWIGPDFILMKRRSMLYEAAGGYHA